MGDLADYTWLRQGNQKAVDETVDQLASELRRKLDLKRGHHPLNFDSSTTPSIEHHPLILNIWSWNVNGHFDTNLSHPNFSKLFDGIDVFFIQETHCYANGGNVPTPPGFTLYSHACAHLDLAHPWGDVAISVCSYLNPHVHDDFSRPDLLTIEVNGTLLMNTYVLPHRSHLNWRDWTNIDPWLFLLSKICLPLILLGDLNACTSFSWGSPNHPTQISLDSKQPDKHGKQLLQCLAACDTFILNGSEGIPGDHFSCTEHQSARISVDDECHKIYGVATIHPAPHPPVLVHVTSVCKNAGQPNAVMGSSVFFGDGNAFNLSKHVPGDQSHDHAILYAMLLT
ncbi:hypothetical protein D9758_016189 [Tetrapyrgos nigripes]|uniref:Endonuclease/exonuclease/phosphatase domain-containing protein n=1 Tax=Tetrapyrgos nigripes TaxID=182062 RepID=A0A8H5C6F9_9AGAR|nr:hypothetical protein D9758_016189 [Tetrapyrgos nigripes]